MIRVIGKIELPTKAVETYRVTCNCGKHVWVNSKHELLCFDECNDCAKEREAYELDVLNKNIAVQQQYAKDRGYTNASALFMDKHHTS